MRGLEVTVLAAGVAVAVCVGLTGCGGNTNAGQTACNEFRSMSTDAQVSAVTQMMKDHHLATDQNDVFITLGSARAFCGVMPGNATISGIYSG